MRIITLAVGIAIGANLKKIAPEVLPSLTGVLEEGVLRMREYQIRHATDPIAKRLDVVKDLETIPSETQRSRLISKLQYRTSDI